MSVTPNKGSRAAGATSGAYSASKFAMEAITNVLRLELAPWGISVSAIEPGFIRTPLVEGSVGSMETVWASLLPNVRISSKVLQN
mgnify:CR=1 FL=1